MRKFLVAVLLVFCVMAFRQAVAGIYRGAAFIPHENSLVSPSSLLNVQFVRKGNMRIRRPRIQIKRFRRPAPVYRPRGASRVYLAPRRAIRRNPGVLRQAGRRPVSSSFAPPARDIGAGAAVQTARTRAAGEVLGVRRNGSVYDVKMLNQGRVRIVTIDAVSGNVLSVR